MTTFSKMEISHTSTSATDGKQCEMSKYFIEIFLLNRFLLDFKREFSYPTVYRLISLQWIWMNMEFMKTYVLGFGRQSGLPVTSPLLSSICSLPWVWWRPTETSSLTGTWTSLTSSSSSMRWLRDMMRWRYWRLPERWSHSWSRYHWMHNLFNCGCCCYNQKKILLPV